MGASVFPCRLSPLLGLTLRHRTKKKNGCGLREGRWQRPRHSRMRVRPGVDLRREKERADNRWRVNSQPWGEGGKTESSAGGGGGGGGATKDGVLRCGDTRGRPGAVENLEGACVGSPPRLTLTACQCSRLSAWKGTRYGAVACHAYGRASPRLACSLATGTGLPTLLSISLVNEFSADATGRIQGASVTDMRRMQKGS